jgi:hypothetical protein
VGERAGEVILGFFCGRMVVWANLTLFYTPFLEKKEKTRGVSSKVFFVAPK